MHIDDENFWDLSRKEQIEYLKWILHEKNLTPEAEGEIEKLLDEIERKEAK